MNEMMPTNDLKINGYTQSLGTSFARLPALLIIIYAVIVRNNDLKNENSNTVTGASLFKISLPRECIPV